MDWMKNFGRKQVGRKQVPPTVIGRNKSRDLVEPITVAKTNEDRTISRKALLVLSETFLTLRSRPLMCHFVRPVFVQPVFVQSFSSNQFRPILLGRLG